MSSRRWMGRGALALSVCGAVGCSWDRFDQLHKDAPLQPLTPPAKTASFGASVAAVFDGKRAFALGLGRQLGGPGASYVLGLAGAPELSPDRSDFCVTAPPTQFCSPAATPAGLGVAYSGSTPHKACFAYGSGSYEGREGILGLCADSVVIVYPIPTDLTAKLVTPTLSEEETAPLRLAAPRTQNPHLLAGVPDAGRAFFYRPGDETAVDLDVDASAHPSFGSAVAVLGDGSTTVVFAVSAPKKGEIWLFRDSTAAGLEPLGCQSLKSGDAAVLGAGSLDNDAAEDLVFTAGGNVKAISGAALFALPADTSGSCSTTLFGDTELFSVRCEESEQVKGCADADYASTFALFDTDGDGRDELAVGAPGFTVGGKKEAGALLVYSSAGKFTDVVYRGDGVEKGRFASSLAPVAQKDRDVLVVGEPGNNSISIAYCAGLTSGDGGARCSARVSE